MTTDSTDKVDGTDIPTELSLEHGTGSQTEVHERCQSVLTELCEQDDHHATLFEALPSAGKSYSALRAALETEQTITILTGRHELQGQFKSWCEEMGLDGKIIPSFPRDCPSANGTHGDGLAEAVMKRYGNGTTSKILHERAPEIFGHPLPCSVGGECPYTQAMKMLNPASHDVLIGHYTHGHIDKVVCNRKVVIDEFPKTAYLTELDGINLHLAIGNWLNNQDEIPYSSFNDLIENRSNNSRRATALEWFREDGTELDYYGAAETESSHAVAPLVVKLLLTSDPFQDGYHWEFADLDRGRTGVFNYEENSVHILQPPDLTCADGVIALDGTPTKELWELVLGMKLEHRRLLSNDERRAYIRDILGLEIYQTSLKTRPYSSGNYVTVERDRLLLNAINAKHDEKPAIITSMKALYGGGTNQSANYSTAGLLELVDVSKHRGNLIGSNKFKEYRLGVIIGSSHYGDSYIEKWSALAGKVVERSGKGNNLTYGEFGDKVHRHMTEHNTVQEILRFGRDAGGAVVYVDTSRIPDWIPIIEKRNAIKRWSPGMKKILRALEVLGECRTSELVDYLEGELSEQHIRNRLHRLCERGVVAKRREGRGYTWTPTGLHELHDEYDVRGMFDGVELTSPVAKVSHNNPNMAKFRNNPFDMPSNAEPIVNPGENAL